MNELAVRAYNVADTQYWKHHDPPEIPNPGESGPEALAVNAALARIARTPPKPTKRPPAPDFARAKEAFAYVAEHADPKSYWHRDARRMLASIALREGRPRDAIRWCEQLPGNPCSDRMAWAYLQLGDRKTAMKWLARDNGPSHRGLLAELSGDDAAAVTAYRDPMTSQVPYWQTYNTAASVASRRASASPPTRTSSGRARATNGSGSRASPTSTRASPTSQLRSARSSRSPRRPRR